jgi:hypothetical protein
MINRNMINRTHAMASLVCALAVPLGAQWLEYPTPGIPRTPDGKPNLSAPAPRTPDGKPDFSGLWGWELNRGGCPPEGCLDLNVGQEFSNIGWSLKDGLPYQPWAAAVVKATRAANRPNDPQTRCLPTGPIRLHTFAGYRKIIQVPGLLVILNEFNASYRQIFTDARPLPVDPNPSFNGYSTGKWAGDTLVVETNGLRDGLWLDTGGSPLTDAARITERFRRATFGKMEVEITVNDPKAYTRPWTIKLNQPLVPDTELLDYICIENEKDVPHLPVTVVTPR